MNRKSWIVLVVGLVMIGGSAGALSRTKASLKLGRPGIKTSSIPGSQRLNLYLPENVLDYTSELIPTDKGLLDGLPHDTSFLQRRYFDAGRKNWLLMNIVLMGTDRTSIHKPEYCLQGQGWNTDVGETSYDTVRIPRPEPYDLSVKKMVTTRDGVVDGHPMKLRGIYVYWFVADNNELTSSHTTRMRDTALHLLGTGELQRWAYVSCFAVCLPGEENPTYERMKNFLAASVPDFQLVTGSRIASRGTLQTVSR